MSHESESNYCNYLFECLSSGDLFGMEKCQDGKARFVMWRESDPNDFFEVYLSENGLYNLQDRIKEVLDDNK